MTAAPFCVNVKESLPEGEHVRCFQVFCSGFSIQLIFKLIYTKCHLVVIHCAIIPLVIIQLALDLKREKPYCKFRVKKRRWLSEVKVTGV